MSRMIDLIRQSAVPANLMRTAARGALSLPTAEMLEILVFLAKHPIFGEQAKLTLAGWDEAATLAVVSDPQAPAEVLDYLSAPANLRPGLVRALLENPAVPEDRLVELAQTASRDLLTVMIASPRVRSSPAVLHALLSHPKLTGAEQVQLQANLQAADSGEREAFTQDVSGPDLTTYLREHAVEIAAEQDKPFRLIDWTVEEQAEVAAVQPAPAKTGVSLMAAAARALSNADKESEKRLTPVQKIAKMTVRERVQLALRGDRDDRFILIRDGSKIVSRSVLESPKLSESEVESFAALRNVSDSVLRAIAAKRKFMRNYCLKRILTANPLCPPDVSLPLAKELLAGDLKKLMVNKNVSDLLRRFAYKQWKAKTSSLLKPSD